MNHVILYVPERCERCQAPLPQEPGPDDPEPTWHQVAELPEVLAMVTEHQGHARMCPCCGHVTWSTVPHEILAHAFGPNLTATPAFLSGCGHDSKRTVEEIAETGWALAGKLCWSWLAVTNRVAFFKICAGRCRNPRRPEWRAPNSKTRFSPPAPRASREICGKDGFWVY